MSRPLPAILRGSDRAQALYALHDEMGRALRYAVNEERLAEIVAPDPSLLLDDCQHTGVGFAGASNLMVCQRMGWLKPIEVVLRAGVHPDDVTAFGGRTLLEPFSGKASLPRSDMVELALRYGADAAKEYPLRGRESYSACLARHYLSDLVFMTNKHLPEGEDLLRSIRALLAAAPALLDPVTLDGSASWGHSFLVLMGSCRYLSSPSPATSQFAEATYEVMRLAATRGADIDFADIRNGAPAVWSLIQGGHARSAAVLLECGANHAWPESTPFPFDWPAGLARPTLAEYAERQCGSAGGAVVREALMKKTIGLGARGQGDASPAPRRRPAL